MKKAPIRQVLASNLVRLMATTPGMETQPAVAKRAGMGQSTVSRIARGEQGATVDMVDALARAFGVQAWELLVDAEETRQAALTKMILGPRSPSANDEQHHGGGDNSRNPKEPALQRRRKNERDT